MPKPLPSSEEIRRVLEDQWANGKIFSGCRVVGWEIQGNIIFGRQCRLMQPEWRRRSIRRRGA